MSRKYKFGEKEEAYEYNWNGYERDARTSGEKGILYCKREPIKYASGKIEHQDHVMNILKKDEELLIIDGQIDKFIQLEQLTYNNSRYIYLNI